MIKNEEIEVNEKINKYKQFLLTFDEKHKENE